MKKLLLFVCLFSTVAMFGQKAMFQSNLTLKDGERKKIESNIPSTFLDKKTKIQNKHIEKILNNSLLRSIDIRRFEKNITEGSDEWEYYLLSADYFVLWSSRDADFQPYLHNIVKSKNVRAVLYDIVAGIICDLCRLFPKDYKAKVITALTRAKKHLAVMNLKKIEYSIQYERLFGGGDIILLIDGIRASHEFALSIEGFLCRRVLMDNIPINELAGYIDKLLAMVNPIDVSANGDVLASVNINNDLTYYQTANGEFYIVNRTRKKYSGDYHFVQKDSYQRDLYQLYWWESSTTPVEVININ